MGFNACRNLSVLLLAGAALIGCNNGPQKNKDVITSKGPQPFQPGGVDQANKGGLPGGTPVSSNGFPMSNPDPNANPFLKASGPGQPALSQGVQQPSAIGSDPGRFAPMSVPGGAGNSPPLNGPFGPPTNPASPAPSLQKAPMFGDSRDLRLNPQTLDPAPNNNGPIVPIPPNWDKNR